MSYIGMNNIQRKNYMHCEKQKAKNNFYNFYNFGRFHVSRNGGKQLCVKWCFHISRDDSPWGFHLPIHRRSKLKLTTTVSVSCELSWVVRGNKKTWFPLVFLLNEQKYKNIKNIKMLMLSNVIIVVVFCTQGKLW